MNKVPGMGWYDAGGQFLGTDEHINAVAERMAERMKNGERESAIWKYLTGICKWKHEEADTIIAKSKIIIATSKKRFGKI